MDIVTQGIAGALLAQMVSSREHRRYATITGLVAGVLPDMDAAIRSASDPLLTLEFHRQFSHSLLFIPVGALIASLILWPFMRQKLSTSRLYLFSLLGFSSAGLLDACTSFGTQLFWPFSDERIAWNLLAIIDPLFTLLILSMVVAFWRSGKKIYPVSGFVFALAYLLLAFSQQQAALQIQHELAQSRKHHPERSVIKPTLGNIVLWRSVYLHQGRYYVDAIRPAIFASTRIYTGKSIAAYRLDTRINELAIATKQNNDILRFQRLSDGFLVKHPEDENVLGDIRYAMLPNSAEPLWGIRLNPNNLHEHVQEATFRENNIETRRSFFRMVLGRNL